jgi:Rps23 Pro-64 3,4-dihydroxylase Tpa1-like proline 4-hydroxylase
MLKKLHTLLSNEELIFLNSICSSFVEIKSHSIISKEKNNYYLTKILNSKIHLLEYQKKCITHLDGEYEIQGSWINKINAITNQNDDFHTDESDISIVTYLNEDFEGGEFEYIFNDETIKIRPIKNTTLIMNREIRHRVLNVTNGERFSLIFFYKKLQKKQKTLV